MTYMRIAICFLFLFVSSMVKCITLDELSERQDHLAEEVKKIAKTLEKVQALLSQRSTGSEAVDTCVFTTTEETVELPEELSLKVEAGQVHTKMFSLYVFFERDLETNYVFVDYLRKQLPDVAIEVITDFNKIPEDERGKVEVLYVHVIQSRRLKGNFDEDKVKKCLQETDKHCTFVGVGFFAANSKDGKITTMGLVRTMEFRKDPSTRQYYTEDEDTFNKKQLSDLRNLIKQGNR